MSKRRTGKVVSAELIDSMASHIQEMSDNDLRLFIIRMRSLTSTNCWWFKYGMRESLLDYARNERRLRTSNRRRSKRTNESK